MSTFILAFLHFCISKAKHKRPQELFAFIQDRSIKSPAHWPSGHRSSYSLLLRSSFIQIIQCLCSSVPRWMHMFYELSWKHHMPIQWIMFKLYLQQWDTNACKSMCCTDAFAVRAAVQSQRTNISGNSWRKNMSNSDCSRLYFFCFDVILIFCFMR